MVKPPLYLTIALLLAACVPQSGRLDGSETGLVGAYSRQVVISDHPHHVLYGHVIWAERNGEEVRAVIISQRRDGVHAWRAREAWAGEVQLPYRATSRAMDGCSHGHCLNRSVGMIFLSEGLYDHALSHGLSARLIGRSGVIDIVVPATLFALD